jgi:hypothetical protein
MEHVLHGHAQRVRIAEDHHAEGVADEDDVGAGGVGDLAAGVVVRGEHPDARLRLHGADGGDGDLLAIVHHSSLEREERRESDEG